MREPDRAKRILDRAIALFDIAEDERDEHRSDAVGVVVRKSRHEALAEPRAQRLARACERIGDGRGRLPTCDFGRERLGIERERAQEMTPRGDFREITTTWIRRARDRVESPHAAQPLTHAPLRPRAGDRQGEKARRVPVARSVLRRDAHTVIADERHIAQQTSMRRRLAKVARENVRREANRRAAARDRALDDDERAVAIRGRTPRDKPRDARVVRHLRKPQPRAEQPRGNRQQRECAPRPSRGVSRRITRRITRYNERHRPASRRRRAHQHRPRDRRRTRRPRDARVRAPIRARRADPHARRHDARRDRHERLRIARFRPFAHRGRATALRGWSCLVPCLHVESPRLSRGESTCEKRAPSKARVFYGWMQSMAITARSTSCATPRASQARARSRSHPPPRRCRPRSR